MLRKLASYAILASTVAVAAPAMAESSIQKYIAKNAGAKPDAMVEFEVGKMYAIEDGGQTHYMSQNGRYIFTGRLVDVWERREVTNIQQLAEGRDVMNLEKMGLHPSRLNSVSLGRGPEEVTLFVDPACEPCHGLIRQARKVAEMSDKYTFHIVVIPALGDASHKLAQAFHCTSDKGRRLDALLKNTLHMLPQPENCDTSGYQLTLAAAEITGINGVPFLLNQQWRVTRGTPNDFQAWLEGAR